MTHHATHAGLRLRSVHDLLDGRVHHAAVQQCGIVTACTPLRRLYAVHLLHVLNALAVPLIVERREVMGGAVPLLEDVLMAAFAGVGLHEELRWYVAVAIHLRRAGEKLSACAVALVIHRKRRDLGIANDEMPAPGTTRVLGSYRDNDPNGNHAEGGNPRATFRLTAATEPPTCQQRHRDGRHRSVRHEQLGLRT